MSSMADSILAVGHEASLLSEVRWRGEVPVQSSKVVGVGGAGAFFFLDIFILI